MIHALLLSLMLTVTIPEKPPTGIYDEAGLLSEGSNQDLQKLFDRVRTEQGVNLGLLTLKNLDDEPKAVAVRAINYWNLSPDSVLILVSLNPKKIYLQPGNNLQYRFTEAVSVGIIRDHMTPAMKAGRFSAGIINGFQAVSSVLPGPAVAKPNTPSRPEPTAVAAGPTSEESWPKRHPILFLFMSMGLTAAFAAGARALYLKREEEKAAQKRKEEATNAYFARLEEAQRRERQEREKDPLKSVPQFNRAEHKPIPSAKPLPPPPTARVQTSTTAVNQNTNVVFIQNSIPEPAPTRTYRAPDPSPPAPLFFVRQRQLWRWGGGFSWGSDSGSSGGGSDGGGGGGSDW